MPTNANTEYNTNTIITAHNTNRTIFPNVPPPARFLPLETVRRLFGSAEAGCRTGRLLGTEDFIGSFGVDDCLGGCVWGDDCGLGGAAVADRPYAVDRGGFP